MTLGRRPGQEHEVEGSPARHAGGADLLQGRQKRLTLEAMEDGESVLFCLFGHPGQALVALDHRLLVVKAGVSAGFPRGHVASFPYAEIADVGVDAGEASAAIRISPLGRVEQEWWQSRQRVEDPLKAVNCLLVPAAALRQLEPYLDRLRELVAAAKKEGGAPGRSGEEDAGARLVFELERLAALHAAGALSDDEFARAKQALLGNHPGTPSRQGKAG